MGMFPIANSASAGHEPRDQARLFWTTAEIISRAAHASKEDLASLFRSSQ
jgi:hypothetical protein